MSESPNSNPLDLNLMREALALASAGRGAVEPNPMVGCIIHKAGQVIGRGYHQRFGAPHAEPNALASCNQSPAGATAVVTLEPCCHTNKKTPPCVPALIAAGIRRVVIGHLDPNPQVSGQGAAQLRAAGLEVTTGVLEKQCQQLNAPFFALTSHARPYVTLKWAQSADGLVGGTGNTPRRISCPQSTRLVHHLRARCDAILVSSDTVIADDPMLTPRDVPILRTPIRCVLDTHLRTPITASLIQTAREIPTLLFCAPNSGDPQKRSALLAAGVQIHELPAAAGHVDLSALLAALGQMKLTHLLVEPGPRLAAAFLRQNLADRLWIIQSSTQLSEPNAPQAIAAPFPPTAFRTVGSDQCSEYLNPHSPVFFNAQPTPEFTLDI